MNRTTSQKELDSESIALKRNVTQALEDMVNFEEKVRRNEKAKVSIKKEVISNLSNTICTLVGMSFGFGFVLGYSLTSLYMYINGRSEQSERSENNQR